jgi:hypothetical protein
MRKLIALLVGLLAAIGAVVTILFFWRRRQGSWDSTWSSAKDTATSWGKTATDQAEKVVDNAAAQGHSAREEASSAVEEVKGPFRWEA